MSNQSSEALLEQEFKSVLTTLLASVREETGGVLGNARRDIDDVMSQLDENSNRLQTAQRTIDTALPTAKTYEASIRPRSHDRGIGSTQRYQRPRPTRLQFGHGLTTVG